ncbi:hypothetical protein [Fodinicola feengrottensis]|uniref:Uncharacterized protein n=1 Tax=Fodinicola feengrottensis TaxID=435914 RepID=A0ABN2GLC6_9ACTN|nr:hypothetical protein [Fodinicola feengrottensis]
MTHVLTHEHQQDGPTSLQGLRNVFAAAAPSYLTSDVSDRLFHAWVAALQAFASQIWRIDWRVLCDVATTDYPTDPEAVQARLEIAVGLIPVMPRQLTRRPDTRPIVSEWRAADELFDPAAIAMTKQREQS